MTNRIVIVGGGLAAARVAKAFREAGGKGSVTMLSADSDPPYNRPPLSKGFLRGELEADAVFVEPRSRLRRARHRPAARQRGHRHRRRAARTVTLADGERACPTTSSCSPRARCRARSASPGEELAGVHRYRTLADAQRRARGRRVGEQRARDRRRLHRHGDDRLAAAPRARGHADRRRRPALRVAAGAAAVGLARAALPRAGRRRHPRRHDRRVPRQRRQAHRSGHRERPRDRRPSSRSSASACSPRPAISKARASTSSRGTRASSTSASRATSPASGPWATSRNFHDPVFGHRRLIQHWTNANHQGERLGRLLAGDDTPYDQVAFFFSEVFGTKIGLLGDLDGGHDELVMRGSLEDGALIGWYLRDDRLVAALIVGQPPEVQERDQLAAARARAREDRGALADPAATAGAGFDTGD